MKTLQTTKSKIRPENIKNNFFVLDTETTKLEPMKENFVFGVLYGNMYKFVFYKIEELLKELEKPKFKKKYIFAHNAEFDLLTIFGNIYINLDSTAVFNGKFISAHYLNGITFADSLNIFPSSVQKIGETIGLKKLENEKVKTEGLNKNNITQLDIDYCIRDCEIIYIALAKIFESTGTIRITLASLSMFTFRNQFLKKPIYYNEFNDEFHESYYGGRTECFKIGKVNAKVFDVNSMYPFAMVKIKFPDTKTLKKETNVDSKYLLYLLKRFEGMAKVTVDHKNTYFGYLPCRKEINNQTKLLFPIGIFETTVNFNELKFAVDNEVVKILKVDYVVYSNAIESPFVDFVKFHYEERLKTVNELEKLIYKLKSNSLYGKFGQKIKYNTEYFDTLPYEIISELKKTSKFYELKLFSQYRSDCFLTTEREKFKNSFFAIPSFSSYITSYCRVLLLKSLLQNENNSVVYCDTDSVFLEGEFIGTVNNELGSFKEENKNVIEIRGLKNYTAIENGIKKDIIKGISKNSLDLGNGKFEILKYHKTLESLRRNVEAGLQYKMTKELKHVYNKRQVLKDGNTKPIQL